MAIEPLLLFLFACAVVVTTCVIVYKLSLPLAFKIIDLCFESPRFRSGISFFIALFFFAIGTLQLIDFMEVPSPFLSRFFPLSFLIAGLFIYVGSLKESITK